MYSHREESALRSAFDAGLRGQRKAPSDRRRVVLVALFAMQARCRGAAQAAREQAARARAIAERLDAAAQAHEADAEKIRGLARRVRAEGLPEGLARYCPRGWLELTG